MAHELDIQRIIASVFKHLGDGFAGNIHWSGTEGADDASWIEPWLNVKCIRGRTNDWLYQVAVTVNVFVKDSDATYTIFALAGEVAVLFKAVKVLIKDYEAVLPVIKGCISFKEPESIDMGERQERSGGTAGRSGLRQVTVRCDGSAYPIAS